MSEDTKNQTIKYGLFKELQDKRGDVGHFEESILRKYGWVPSSGFPDCHWRWVKSIKGVTLACDAKAALGMEQEIVEYQ